MASCPSSTNDTDVATAAYQRKDDSKSFGGFPRQILQSLYGRLDGIQRVLALDFLSIRIDDAPDDEQLYLYPQFSNSKTSLGRAGLLGSLLGVVWGIHVMGMLACASSCLWYCSKENENDDTFSWPSRLAMLWVWCFYMTALSTFHLLEFFVTCLYNPTEASSDSFLINHSKAYTAAILLATTEFWIRWLFFPLMPSIFRTSTGITIVIMAQSIRTAAMATCGESFNHFIQTSKKDNHVLVKHGIYRYLRHPSYVGFWYYSVGTQVVLGNWMSMVAFAMAGWAFFSRRIPYEERSLIHHFGDDYYEYAKDTYIGIPFISKRGLEPEDNEEDGESEKSDKGVEQVWTKVDGTEAHDDIRCSSGIVKKTQ
jgi:protein-S-isoprenylcysteine O-methyltransferase